MRGEVRKTVSIETAIAIAILGVASGLGFYQIIIASYLGKFPNSRNDLCEWKNRKDRH